jgi:glycosyltransferase involved in cell wall biosynthesis
MYDLLFTGNMSYPPNVEGAQRLVNDVLPLVHQVKPNVTLLLAGANPTSAVRSLASEAVTVSGWLDDMRTAYSEAKVFVAPMRSGSGMQNKLLEAMCMELPCVTTSLAAAPLSALHGSQVLIGNSDEEIAQHILYLLDNPKQADELARESRLFVQENFEWASTVKDLVDHCFC